MADLLSTLKSDLTAAIRSRDEVTMATLRMALAAITTEQVAGASARVLSDEEIVVVLTREARKRREAAAAFTSGNRPELAQREMDELAVLARYLPAPLTDEEVQALVADAIAAEAADGVTGMAAMGRVMKRLTPITTGRYDGAALAAIVRTALT